MCGLVLKAPPTIFSKRLLPKPPYFKPSVAHTYHFHIWVTHLPPPPPPDPTLGKTPKYWISKPWENSANQDQHLQCMSFPLHRLDRVKQIWYSSPMRAAKVQASLRIRPVSPEPSLLAHTNSESRGTFRQKARYLTPLNGWACAVKICNDRMLEDTNSLDGARLLKPYCSSFMPITIIIYGVPVF